VKHALLFALLAAAVKGQSAAPIAFEATSIKPNGSGGARSGMNVQPARIKVINSTLKFCVEVAWNVKDFQVSGGGSWTDSDRFDIDAVAASPFLKDEYRAMLQTLLADRFGLVIHHEIQDRAGYALVVGRNGPKLPPPIEDPSILFSRTSFGDTTLTAPNVSMTQLAGALSSALAATVVDRTGIEGKFNIFLQWTPDSALQPRIMKSGEPAPAAPPDTEPGPSLFTALQEKLGLKLESRKVPVEMIVIDRASRPSEN
jgi:uncharacterized protein (TIGR03435 family)